MKSYQYLIDYFENAPTIIQVVWISICIFCFHSDLNNCPKIFEKQTEKMKKTVVGYHKGIRIGSHNLFICGQ